MGVSKKKYNNKCLSVFKVKGVRWRVSKMGEARRGRKIKVRVFSK
jgi:hypothetical protein